MDEAGELHALSEDVAEDGPTKIVLLDKIPPPFRFTFSAILLEPTRVVLNSSPWIGGGGVACAVCVVAGPLVKMILCDGDWDGLCRSRMGVLLPLLLLPPPPCWWYCC